MSGRQILRQVCRLAACAALVALSMLLSFSPVPMATAVAAVPEVATTAPPSPLAVSLTRITPTVAVPKAPIRITGRVRNLSSVPVASPVTRALVGESPLTSRQAVSDWAGSASHPSLKEVAHKALGKSMKPGSSTAFTLTIPASSIIQDDSFAVIALRIEVVGTTPTATQERGGQNTFLPALGSIKAYEPVSIAWLVPLTLDPDPALHGMDSPARTAAWAKAIGPGSRLDRLILGTQDAAVTWAIDPAILGPRQVPGSLTSSAGPTPTPSTSKPTSPRVTETPDPVTEKTKALTNRLKAASPRHTLWSLPYADPDLAALTSLASGTRVLATLMSRPSTLDAAVGPARSDIAWPVDGKLTSQSEAQLRRAFAAPPLAAAVTSTSTLTSSNGSLSDSSHKSSSGLPLLAYDEALSKTVAQTSSRQSGAITVQRFLADSMALLGERPGTRNRSVLIAEPRTFDGDPTVLGSLFAAVAKAPWLVTTSTDELLAASEAAPASAPNAPTVAPPAPAPSPTTPPVAVTPPSAGTSPLTAGQLQAIPGTLSAITGIASILDDGQLFRQRWSDAQDQLTSARWRDQPEGLADIESDTAAAISTVSDNINVAPSSVNFFADRGVLQVTVVNALAVPIHDVHLTLTPAQPRLRIEQQTAPLKIGAKSRANVPLQVTAIAAGLVPIEAVLTTRNGTPLGPSARVDVRVQPTSTWIYWVLSGLAGLVLVLGTYRSLRRGSTRAAHPKAKEPVFHG